jgi:hypothetical protein
VAWIGGLMGLAVACIACIACGGRAVAGGPGNGASAPDGGGGADDTVVDGAVVDGAAVDAAVVDVAADRSPGAPADDDAGDASADVAAETAPPACTLAVPTFMPPDQSSILAGTTVSISDPATVQGLEIYYTLDGTIPDHASPLYTGPIQINDSLTVHAMAVAPGSGCGDSQIGVASYQVIPLCPIDALPPPSPVFRPPAGKYPGDFDVTLSVAVSSATICYTLDGQTVPACEPASPPCIAGLLYDAATPIHVDATVRDAQGNVTIQAVACVPFPFVDSGCPWPGPSMVISQLYTE